MDVKESKILKNEKYALIFGSLIIKNITQYHISLSKINLNRIKVQQLQRPSLVHRSTKISYCEL